MNKDRMESAMIFVCGTLDEMEKKGLVQYAGASTRLTNHGYVEFCRLIAEGFELEPGEAAMAIAQYRAYTANAILDEVQNERDRQDRKWGVQNHDAQKWLAILAAEFGELAKEVVQSADIHNNSDLRGTFAAMRKEAIQVAAVAVAMVECCDRNEWIPQAPSAPAQR